MASNGEQALPRFERLGISRNEAKVYLSLLETYRATAAELGDMSGVPRSKVYAVLRGLEQKGFAIALEGPVARFQAVPSSAALRGWVTQRAHEREFANDADHQLTKELLEVLPQTDAGKSDHAGSAYIEGVSGKARIAATSERLITSAQTSLLMVQQPPYFQPPSRWNELEVAAFRRGVDVRVIYSRDAIGDPRRYEPLHDVGASLRVLDLAPMKLISRDGKEALVALRDPLTGEQGVTSAVIHHPDLVAAIELLFEKEWARGQPVTA